MAIMKEEARIMVKILSRKMDKMKMLIAISMIVKVSMNLISKSRYGHLLKV